MATSCSDLAAMLLRRSSLTRSAAAAIRQGVGLATFASTSRLAASPKQDLRRSTGFCDISSNEIRRSFATSALHCADKESDPGGKPIPTDGSYRTVYDDFNNITADEDPGLAVDSIGDSHFTLSDGLVCHSPIIVLQRQILLWDPPEFAQDGLVMPSGRGWEQWQSDLSTTWKLFELCTPRPEIIVFGTGKTTLPLPTSIKHHLNRLGIQIEAHDTRNACATYNMLAEEGRLVAAALLPLKRKPTQRIRSTQ